MSDKRNNKTLRSKLSALWQIVAGPSAQPAPESLFAQRYREMHNALKTLTLAERERVDFFIAATAVERPVTDYIIYIRRIDEFCTLCPRNPALAKGFDPTRLRNLSIALSLMIAAIASTDKPYLDHARQNMPVPVNQEMEKRVKRTEITMLREDILARREP